MSKREQQYSISTSNSSNPSVQIVQDDPSPRESLSNYMELRQLRTISSGWLADEDSDESPCHYYNFPVTIRNAHSDPNI